MAYNAFSVIFWTAAWVAAWVAAGAALWAMQTGSSTAVGWMVTGALFAAGFTLIGMALW